MHAKTDSEVTSLAPSSPTRSPRSRNNNNSNHNPVYYVQSPSRDSHDGEKTTTSFHSTPVISPMGSPPHSHSSVGHHSRESSSSRFSGSLKPGSRKISSNHASTGGRKGQKSWKECAVIEEEGLLEEEGHRTGRSQKPQIDMMSLTFEGFIIQAGSDSSGVATEMVTTNSSVKFTFRNTAAFFGVHVTSTPLDLSFSQLSLATGNVKKFYQSRKSHRTMTVVLEGNKVPLYGAGADLSTGTGTGTITVPLPMKLNFMVRSRAYVLGKLVKPKFYKKIECSVVLDPKKLNVPISLKSSCTYD
ncbi:hypothetical protein GIB67_017583 [Kingdonia uniflora]|uniref:Late embryogenesis abundant protein LEA-2 subgroup domain-containing protein n=1 Tax=Kingdonia uniflora TaxID=39325 RepID=A0A7J7LMS5_9MAGN|nr:hypothetical protein GIB67_017583 [Kingdonia uniflora]